MAVLVHLALVILATASAPIAQEARPLPPIGQAFLSAASTGCADYVDKGRPVLATRFASSDSVPAYVSAGATDVTLGKPSYFHAPALDGDVWIIVFDASSICFVQAYGPALAQGEKDIVRNASASGWALDDKLVFIRNARQIRVFATARGGRRVQMVLINPQSYQSSDQLRPLAISGYVEAVEKGQ